MVWMLCSRFDRFLHFIGSIAVVAGIFYGLWLVMELWPNP